MLGWLPPLVYRIAIPASALVLALIPARSLPPIALRHHPSLLAIWPLLTPPGGFFADMSGGEITMPWIATWGSWTSPGSWPW